MELWEQICSGELFASRGELWIELGWSSSEESLAGVFYWRIFLYFCGIKKNILSLPRNPGGRWSLARLRSLRCLFNSLGGLVHTAVRVAICNDRYSVNLLENQTEYILDTYIRILVVSHVHIVQL